MNRSRYTQPWELTEREEEILVLIADGLSNHEIADQLGISERTARTHCSNILSKLRAPNRTVAAAYVWRERVEILEIENARLRSRVGQAPESSDAPHLQECRVIQPGRIVGPGHDGADIPPGVPDRAARHGFGQHKSNARKGSEMSDELMPCPFCGGNDVIFVPSLINPGRRAAHCRRCRVTGPLAEYEEAADEWNTRPAEDTLRERIAELEAEVTKWRELAEGTAALWTEARDELAELRLCKRAS